MNRSHSIRVYAAEGLVYILAATLVFYFVWKIKDTPVRKTTVPACQGKALDGCVAKLVEEAGGVGEKVKCVDISKTLHYCDVTVPGSCFDSIVRETRQGFPVIQSSAQRMCA